MGSPARNPNVVRFGDCTLDLQMAELRRNGSRVILQDQPFKILSTLLETPGQLVTREELIKRLWPTGTFVDFDQSLNKAVARLREALGDNAEQPVYIETLARRGYRWKTPVEWKKPETVAGPSEQPNAWRRWPWVVAATLAAVLAMMNIGGGRDKIAALLGGNKTTIQSLAVLPLENLSGDPEQEYFADGMTEALITELGKINTPRVISHQSVMKYKGSNKALPEIAGELKVEAVLGGAVERSGERVRVTIHLSQVFPERQLWAKKYDRSLRDVLVLQDEIARAVTDEIQVKLSPQETTRLANARPVNPEAHDAFLRGQFFANKGTEGDLQMGIGYFREAIKKDPSYAEAYAELALALLALGNPLSGGGGHSTKEILPEARAAAAKAMELEFSLAEAHLARAWILELNWDWPEGQKEYQLALKLSPNSSSAHGIYANYLVEVGRFDEATAQRHEQIKLDPLSDHQGEVAFAAFMSRQYDLSIESFRNAGWDHGLGWSYAMKKMYPESIAAFQRFADQWGRQPMVVSDLAMVSGLSGKRQEAKKLLGELKEIARHRYVAPCLFVNAYIGVGDNGQALTWLEKAYEVHDALLVWMKVAPNLDPLRSEPRFQMVLQQMNFPQ